MKEQPLNERAWQQLGTDPFTPKELQRVLTEELQDWLRSEFEIEATIYPEFFAEGLIDDGWRLETTPTQRAEFRSKWAADDDDDAWEGFADE